MMDQVLHDPASATTAADLDPPTAYADAQGGGAMCAATTTVNMTPNVESESGSFDHVTGFHSAISSSNFSCECLANCSSRCNPLSASTATETGVYVPSPSAA